MVSLFDRDSAFRTQGGRAYWSNWVWLKVQKPADCNGKYGRRIRIRCLVPLQGWKVNLVASQVQGGRLPECKLHWHRQVGQRRSSKTRRHQKGNEAVQYQDQEPGYSNLLPCYRLKYRLQPHHHLIDFQARWSLLVRSCRRRGVPLLL